MSNYTAEQVDHLAGLLRYSGTDEFSDEAADAMDAFATTLRQQSGRVDDLLPLAIEGWNEHQARCRITTVEGSLRAALTAALAQNTQGDGEPVAFISPPIPADLPAPSQSATSVVIDHAERARVPEEWRNALTEAMQFANNPAEGHDEGMLLIDLNERVQKLLAAAPSQRAEVK